MNKSPIIRGIQDAIPIMLAYFPISMTFGVISTGNGISWLTTFLISAWVYAGGAQFMLVSLVLTGTSPISIIVTVLLVNLRHFLYGTALGPIFKKWFEVKKWIFAFGLTDEVFAVTSSRSQSTLPTPSYQITFAFACYGSWLSGTAIGAGVGRAVPAAISNILSFALPALFLALLFIGQRSVSYFIAAVSGAILSFIANLLHLGSLGIVVGAIVGATLGMYADSRIKGLKTLPSEIQDARLDV